MPVPQDLAELPACRDETLPQLGCGFSHEHQHGPVATSLLGETADLKDLQITGRAEQNLDCRRTIVVCGPDCLILIGAPGIGCTARLEEVMTRARTTVSASTV